MALYKKLGVASIVSLVGFFIPRFGSGVPFPKLEDGGFPFHSFSGSIPLIVSDLLE